MDLAIAVLSVFMFLQVGGGQMPPRPNLSNSYSAKVLVNITTVALVQFFQYQYIDLLITMVIFLKFQYIVLSKHNMWHLCQEIIPLCISITLLHSKCCIYH